MIKEFMEFLKEYKVIGLAIAFIIGIASKDLIKSLVDNIIMPIITPFIPKGAWETATFSLGPIVIKWGAFLGALINFIIIASVVFIVAKKILKENKIDTVEKAQKCSELWDLSNGRTLCVDCHKKETKKIRKTL